MRKTHQEEAQEGTTQGLSKLGAGGGVSGGLKRGARRISNVQSALEMPRFTHTATGGRKAATPISTKSRGCKATMDLMEKMRVFG